MVKHHRQQNGGTHALNGRIRENLRCTGNELGYVRADQRRGSWQLRTTQAEFGGAGERSGESAAGFGRGKAEPRTIEQPFRQQMSRDGKAEQLEVAAVGDL